ncbi:hypothetical protein A6A08_17255 [Nocardiopsis sp. TSRI0078]|uniref:hypothetical protein n=1 Tax=unclassified Nocardiopsis TaxID=2649073 RepID=UPI00093AE53D|nr:hypothetical protein [Nocardiopsis sp. TSRI0078]OKI12311.1 hypothetical protein A6A08_17255 [Nocardiopsis sp. TSRI0078]
MADPFEHARALRAMVSLAVCVGLVATGCATTDDGDGSGSAETSGSTPATTTGAGGANTAEVVVLSVAALAATAYVFALRREGATASEAVDHFPDDRDPTSLP